MAYRWVMQSYLCDPNKTANILEQCSGLELHTDGKGTTCRICAVNDNQLAKLVQFLASQTPGDQQP